MLRCNLNIIIWRLQLILDFRSVFKVCRGHTYPVFSKDELSAIQISWIVQRQNYAQSWTNQTLFSGTLEYLKWEIQTPEKLAAEACWWQWSREQIPEDLRAALVSDVVILSWFLWDIPVSKHAFWPNCYN